MPAEGSSDKSRICLGFIAGAHGLAGAVRLKLQTDDFAAFSAYGPLEDAAGKRRFEFLEIRPGKGAHIGRLKGISDREAAEALKGTELFVERAKLPATDTDEWYHADLIGLEVVDLAGESLGTVLAVQNYGAGDLLEIKPTRGKASILVPFRTDIVPQVDIAGGRITIDPPEGLLDS
jgi:16S rRNA processing protein RimM